MGPAALAITSELGAQLGSLNYFKHEGVELAGVQVQAARMSYVGEAGWEITCKASDVVGLYRALIQLGVKPAGLFAQTSMRIEKGFRAMGHELDSDVSPFDVGLQMFTRKSGGYKGFESLRSRIDKPSPNQIVSLAFLDNSVNPIGHEPIIVNNKIVGKTTSCAFGYRVGKPIALAQTLNFLKSGDRVEVDIAGNRCTAEVTLESLYDSDGSRMKHKVVRS